MSHRLKRWRAFFEAIPRLPLRFSATACFYFTGRKANTWPKEQRLLKLRPSSLIVPSHKGQKNILNHFQDSKTTNYLRESSTGGHLYSFFLNSLKWVGGVYLHPAMSHLRIWLKVLFLWVTLRVPSSVFYSLSCTQFRFTETGSEVRLDQRERHKGYNFRGVMIHQRSTPKKYWWKK